MGLLYRGLFWFVMLTTLSSGLLGFLLKLPAVYRPDAYLVAGAPGTGASPFEVLASYVFGLTYVCPLVGLAYAHAQGSAAAKRAACMAPLAYHAASVFGVLRVFPHALNPAVAPLPTAAGMHAVYVVLLALLAWSAEDDGGGRRSAKQA